MVVTITHVDLAPLVDMLRDFAEDVEQQSPEELAGARDVLAKIASAARDATAIVDQKLIKATEAEPVICNGNLYRRVNEYDYVADHEAVARGVVQAAVDDGGGDAKVTAAKAVKYMRELYVSPSDKPKVGGLKGIGLDRSHVGEEKFKRKKIDVVKMVDDGPEEGA